MWVPSDIRHWKTVGNVLPEAWRERLRFVWWMEDRVKKSLWIITVIAVFFNLDQITCYTLSIRNRRCWRNQILTLRRWKKQHYPDLILRYCQQTLSNQIWCSPDRQEIHPHRWFREVGSLLVKTDIWRCEPGFRIPMIWYQMFSGKHRFSLLAADRPQCWQKYCAFRIRLLYCSCVMFFRSSQRCCSCLSWGTFSADSDRNIFPDSTNSITSFRDRVAFSVCPKPNYPCSERRSLLSTTSGINPTSYSVGFCAIF
jgi:hypothetical protein